MAKPPYSVLIYRAGGLAGIDGPYSPLTGTTVVVKEIDLYSDGGIGGSQIFIERHTAGGVNIAFIIASVASGDKNSYQWRGRQVLNAECGIRFHVTNGAWDITVNGYELSGESPTNVLM